MLPGTVKVVPEEGDNVPVPTLKGIEVGPAVTRENVPVVAKIPVPCKVREVGAPILATLSIDSVAG